MSRIIALVGPTASGKSDVALALAEALGGEIISIDSMQVYRGMDIGTAKPSVEERARVPHHMIDVAEPSVDFTVAEFQHMARGVLDELCARRVPAIVAGGSGLHMRAVLDPLEFPPSDPEVRAHIDALPPADAAELLLSIDPEAGAVLDLANPRRVQRALEIHELTGVTPSQRAGMPAAGAVRAYAPSYPFTGIGLDPGARLSDRSARRLERMIAAGFMGEVRALAPHLGRNASQAVGYKQLLPVVAGTASLEEGVADAHRATVALAKRQRTFFRRDPRITWLPWSDDPEARVRAVLRHVEEVAWSS